MGRGAPRPCRRVRVRPRQAVFSRPQYGFYPLDIVVGLRGNPLYSVVLGFWLGAGGAVDGPASRGADMLASEPVATPTQARRGKALRGIDRQPSFQGWRTTDGQEIERRQWRGRTEVVAVEALEPDREFFGSFRVRAASGNDYIVEIRSLDGLENSCDCLDYRVNGLGT